MQEQYETPFAKMSFKDLQAIFIAKMTEQGNNSAATDEGEARGVHVKRNGVGAGVVKTMSMSDLAWSLLPLMKARHVAYT